MKIYNFDNLDNAQDISQERIDSPKRLIITNLTPSRKFENRVNVFIDDKYSFSLDVAQVVDHKIKIGLILTPQKIKELQHISEYGKLYQRTLEWVLTRPHSIKETKEYLVKKQQKRQLEQLRYGQHLSRLSDDEEYRQKVTDIRKTLRKKRQSRQPAQSFEENNENEYGAKTSRDPFPHKPAALILDEDIESVINQLIEKRYLDDTKFAEFFVENRNARKGESSKKIRLELLQKGIANDIVESVLRDSTRNDNDEILKIISKKYHKYTTDKLVAYLVRQGFDYYLAKDAVDTYQSELLES